MKKLLRERLVQQQFSSIISIAENDLFDLEKYEIIKRMRSNINPFKIKPIVIVADPFLFVYKEELYLFYEEQVKLSGKGVIKMVKTKDLKRWTKPILVLQEDYHLSYPNILELNGQVFMMPETGKNKSIQLYKPNNDLTKWNYYKTILSDRHFVDSDIVWHNDTYFLLTTDYSENKNVLRLYYSDKFDSNWVEHPQSPIATGKNSGRCAGSIFRHGNNLYRPCQLTQKQYGEGVIIYRIIDLSRESYKEKQEKIIIPNSNEVYKTGGHHFNFCFFNNKRIVATDILQKKINYWEVSKRCLSKIKL